jgi:hypothetical protein
MKAFKYNLVKSGVGPLILNFTTVNLLVAGSFFVSCTGDLSVSKQKSLNNFARGSGDVSRNVCSGDQDFVLGIHQEWDHVDFTRAPANKVPELKSALKASLSAVPANLQDLYFGLGGKIIFTPNLGKPATSSTDLTCDNSAANKKFASEGTDRVEACWTIDTKTADIVILMNPTVESVEHATVRIFGYILSQVLTKLDLSEEGTIVTQRNEEFDRFMTDIAAAVIADVRRPGSKYTLAVNQSLISSDEFKYFAFAESFDSYYCNAALRNSMSRPDEFPKTYALFQKMDRELQGIQVSQVAKNYNNTSHEGFSLLGDPEQASFNLGILRGLFGGIGRIGGFLGRGVGALGRGIFNGGRAVLGGAGRLLGGAAGGLGGILGNIGGGGLISMIMNLFGGGG